MKKIIQYIIFAIVNLMFLSFLAFPLTKSKNITKPKDIEKYELLMDEFISALQGDNLKSLEFKLSENILGADNYKKSIKQLKTLVQDKKILKKDLLNYSFTKAYDTMNKEKYTLFNANYELTFEDRYATLNYAIKLKNNSYLINGFFLNFFTEPISEINRLKLSDLDSTDISFIFITVFVILFNITVFNFYFFTEKTRKIRWLIFISFGIISLNLNLNTNILSIDFMKFLLISGGCYLDSTSNQWLLSFSFPVGSLLYLILRNKRLPQKVYTKKEHNNNIDTI